MWGAGGHVSVSWGAFGEQALNVPREWAEPGWAELGQAGAEPGRADPASRPALCRATPPCSLQVSLPVFPPSGVGKGRVG